MRICFYAAVDDPVLFEHVEFYRQDIELLRQMGHTVVPARRPAELRAPFDLVWAWWQTSGVPAVLAARARRIPSVLLTALSDNDLTASGMPGKSLPARAAGRVALRAADLVLACSEDTRLGLVRYPTRRPIETAPLAVDSSLYRPGSAAEKDDYVLCISHLTPDNVSRKRILDVVRAVAAVNGLRALIVGRHSGGEELVSAEVARLGAGDRISLLGSVSAERKRELLQRAMVYVQPSDYEAFGMAIGEAMASGTPVISHAVGNVPSLVGDTGWLLPPGTGADGLADALRAVLASPDERADRGRRARERIEERFSMDARRAALERALAEVRRGR
jgi:glycosyltransferase involved in cell wall biosynthesis